MMSRRTLARPATQHVQQCEHCHANFLAVTGDERFCHPDCRDEWYRHLHGLDLTDDQRLFGERLEDAEHMQSLEDVGDFAGQLDNVLAEVDIDYAMAY